MVVKLTGFCLLGNFVPSNISNALFAAKNFLLGVLIVEFGV